MCERMRKVEKLREWSKKATFQKNKNKNKKKQTHLPALFFAISIAKWSDGDPLAVVASIGYLNVYNISNGIYKSYLIHTCNGFNCHI